MRRVIPSIAAGAAVAVTAAVAVLSSVAPAPTAAATPGVSVVSATQQAKAAKARAALLKYLKNGRPTVQIMKRGGLAPSRKELKAPKLPAASAKGPSSSTAVSSYNWAGYLTTSTTAQAYSAVYGSWSVPKIFCSSEQRLESDWIGLDGYSTSTVEQAGTLGWCFEGTAYYYTWWEMYPSGSNLIGTTVLPGDKVAAKITRSGTSYTLAVTDSTTTANSFSTSQTCAAATCVDESAEWIHERPAFSIGVAPLAPSFTWGPYGGSVVVSGNTDTIATAPNLTNLTMIDATGTYNLAAPTALSTSGKGFSVKYANSY